MKKRGRFMKAKLAVLVLVGCVSGGAWMVRYWASGQQALPTSEELEEKGVQEPLSPQSSAPLPKTVNEGNGVRRVRTVIAEAEILQLLEKAMEKTVGEVHEGAEGRQKLVVSGKVLLEGYELGPAAGSAAGDVTVAAYDSALPPLPLADLDRDLKNGKLQVSTAAVWYVPKSGEAARQISPSRINAESPCISADGKRIAYSGQELNAQGFPGKTGLYVYRVETAQTLSIRIASRGRVAPLFWDGNVLAVYNGGAETMGAAEVAFLEVPN